jgi:mannose-1-phosphate guanylyltransferase
MLYAVIVAGGQGTRLWPASRKSSPKQLTPFAGGESLIQRTYKRVSGLIPSERIYIVTNEAYAEMFLEQIPALDNNHLILEPVPRNTAAAVGIGTAVVHQIDPEATVVNVWADHYYDDEAGYLKILETAGELLKRYPDHLVNMVATPTYPSSAFDYFQVGEKLEEVDGISLLKVKSFARKPDEETAKKYLEAGDFYWNMTNFVWRTDTLLKLFEQHVPEMHAGLIKMAEKWATPEWQMTLEEEFPKLASDTIDYAIFEKTPNIILIPTNLGWRDVGNWQIVYSMLSDIDGTNLVSRGKVVTVEAKNSLIFSENPGKLVAVVGVDDLVVVDTPDALLVMRKSKDQDVKKVIEEIKLKGEMQHL